MSKLFARSTTAKIISIAAVMAMLSTPSQAFFFFGGEGYGYHHFKHFKHFKHVKSVKQTGPALGNSSTPAWAAYLGIATACATISVMASAAMNGNKPLSLGQAHGTALGCFLPLIGPWLVTAHYERLCALSRTNPAMREYRIYCNA